MEAKLVVVGGEVKASEIKLKLPTIIGRGKGATLLLQHPLVSRQHCEIYEDNGRLVVRDMGSLNGTFVNNARLTEPTFLPSGDLLTIGDVTFRAEYHSDPNLKPPDGPKTARIGGLPTSQAIKLPKEPDDSAEDIDFGAVEVVDDDEETPKVNSLDDIPAISASDAEFDPMAFLDDEEPAPKKPTVPAPKAPAAKTPAPPAKTPVTKPEAKKSAEIKPPEPKSSAKPTSPASKSGGSSGGPAKTGGAPGSRWVVPGTENNETLRTPAKPKGPAPKPEPPSATSTKEAVGVPKLQIPEAKAPKPKDDAADFLAALGMDDASSKPMDAPSPATSSDAKQSAAPEDFLASLRLEEAPAATADLSSDSVADFDVEQIEVVDELPDEQEVAVPFPDEVVPTPTTEGSGPFSAEQSFAAEDLFADAPPASDEPHAEAASMEELEAESIEIEEVEEIAEVEDVIVTPPTPAAEAASAIAPPPTVAETPSIPADELTAAADDDIASFLSGLAAEPVTHSAAADSAEEIADIEAVEIEEPEVVDVEELEPAADATPEAVDEPEAAPVVPPPEPGPAIPAAAPIKRPHAAPIPFAMPYTPPKPAAAPRAAAPAAAPAPARRPHAAPRAVPGPAISPPGARPTSPPPPSSGSTRPDEDLSDFLKNLGK